MLPPSLPWPPPPPTPPPYTPGALFTPSPLCSCWLQRWPSMYYQVGPCAEALYDTCYQSPLEGVRQPPTELTPPCDPDSKTLCMTPKHCSRVLFASAPPFEKDTPPPIWGAPHKWVTRTWVEGSAKWVGEGTLPIVADFSPMSDDALAYNDFLGELLNLTARRMLPSWWDDTDGDVAAWPLGCGGSGGGDRYPSRTRGLTQNNLDAIVQKYPAFHALDRHRPPTHFSHMSHPTFPISHILICFFTLSTGTRLRSRWLSTRWTSAAGVTRASSRRRLTGCRSLRWASPRPHPSAPPLGTRTISSTAGRTISKRFARHRPTA